MTRTTADSESATAPGSLAEALARIRSVLAELAVAPATVTYTMSIRTP